MLDEIIKLKTNPTDLSIDVVYNYNLIKTLIKNTYVCPV